MRLSEILGIITIVLLMIIMLLQLTGRKSFNMDKVMTLPKRSAEGLLDAQDKQTIDEARRPLTAKIGTFAKEIHDKYIVPPKTTDFALMFLPAEGLYAAVVPNPALFEELRDRYKSTRAISRTLRSVEELEKTDTTSQLALDDDADESL